MSLNNKLYFDSERKKFVKGFNDPGFIDIEYFLKDLVGVDSLKLHILATNQTRSTPTFFPYLESEIPEITLNLKGACNCAVAGSFKINYKGDESEELGNCIDFCNLQNSLNTIPSIANEGGVEILKTFGECGCSELEDDCQCKYYIKWREKGVREDLTFDSSNLFPDFKIKYEKLMTGTDKINELGMIYFEPYSIVNIVDIKEVVEESQFTATQIQVGGNGTNEIQKIQFEPKPVGGELKLQLGLCETCFISCNSTETDLKKALEKACSGDIKVHYFENSYYVIEWLDGLAKPFLEVSQDHCFKNKYYDIELNWDLEKLLKYQIACEDGGFEPVLKIGNSSIDVNQIEIDETFNEGNEPEPSEPPTPTADSTLWACVDTYTFDTYSIEIFIDNLHIYNEPEFHASDDSYIQEMVESVKQNATVGGYTVSHVGLVYEPDNGKTCIVIDSNIEKEVLGVKINRITATID